MVEKQLRRRGIRDARVLAAMGEIPREEFVPLDIADAGIRRRAGRRSATDKPFRSLT